MHFPKDRYMAVHVACMFGHASCRFNDDPYATTNKQLPLEVKEKVLDTSFAEYKISLIKEVHVKSSYLYFHPLPIVDR